MDKFVKPSYVGNLAGIVDYSTTTDKVLLRFPSLTGNDYYVSFNKATGFNSATGDAINMVTGEISC